jgi:hypothetical protein
MPDKETKVDESKLSASSPPPGRPLSSDRVEPGDQDPKKDVKLLDVVEPTAEEAAAAAAMVRYSSAEAAASIALRHEKDPDSSWASVRNDEDHDHDNYDYDHPSPTKTAPAPLLQVNPPAASSPRPTALPVPQQYRLRPQDLDPQKTDALTAATTSSSSASSSLRGPGAYAIAPRRFGTNAAQAAASNDNSWSNHDDTDTPTTTDLPVFSLDLETALDAQIVPERDLNHEVQQRIEALTIEALTVELKTKDTAARPPRSGAVPKAVILTIIIAVCLMAIGISVGVKNGKGTSNSNVDNESVDYDGSAPSSPSTIFVPDLEFARAIFAPLSGEDVLLDELSPQYKALWWIVHEDPTNTILMTAQNETQWSRSRLLELYAMAVLYFATDGSNWWDQLDFLGNRTVCDWDRAVECDEEGAVLILALGK